MPKDQISADALLANEGILTDRIGGFKTSLTQFKDSLTIVFADGIVTEEDRAVVVRGIESINVEKTILDSKFNSLYNNPKIAITSKDNLYKTKTSLVAPIGYDVRHQELIDKINNIMSDNAISQTEKIELTLAFSNYDISLNNVAAVAEIAETEVEDAATKQLREDLRMTAPLPTSIKINEDGVTAYQTDVSKFARLDYRGLYVQGGAVDIRTGSASNRGIVFDGTGIKGYNATGVNTFNLSNDGNFTASGTITGSNIFGSLIESREDVNGYENYIQMTNNQLRSHGRYTRTWAGETEEAIINLGIRRGQLWISNENTNRNLYFTERGLSTSMEGAISQTTSGTLEFHSQRFNETSRGVTLHSSYGAVALMSDFSTIYTRSDLTTNIESNKAGIYIRPMRTTVTGINEFRFDVKVLQSGFDTDGVLGYGNFTGASNLGSGIRFGKSGNPTIYATNNNGDMGTGDFNARHFYGALRAPSTDAYVMVAWDGELKITDKEGYNNGNINYRDLQARNLRVESIRSNDLESNFYFGVSTGELRITNNLMYNNGNIGYKNIRASGFIEASSEDYKDDITEWDYDALSVIIDEWQGYQYKFKDDPENLYRRGSIVERKTPSEFIAGKGINTYEMNTWALRSIQQLGLKDRKKESRIAELEREVAELKTLIN